MFFRSKFGSECSVPLAKSTRPSPLRRSTGTLPIFLKEENTKFYVRGIRDGKDMDYEEKSFEFSVKLFPEMETLFVNCSKETKSVSSTLVKQLIKDGKPFEKYIPREALPIKSRIL